MRYRYALTEGLQDYLDDRADEQTLADVCRYFVQLAILDRDNDPEWYLAVRLNLHDAIRARFLLLNAIGRLEWAWE